MKRNASITKGKAEPEEADAETDKGVRKFFDSPFGVLVIDDKGITTRESLDYTKPYVDTTQVIRSKKKYR